MRDISPRAWFLLLIKILMKSCRAGRKKKRNSQYEPPPPEARIPKHS